MKAFQCNCFNVPSNRAAEEREKIGFNEGIKKRPSKAEEEVLRDCN